MLRILAFKSKFMYLGDNVDLKISSVPSIFLLDLDLTVEKPLAHEEKLSEKAVSVLLERQ